MDDDDESIAGEKPAENYSDARSGDRSDYDSDREGYRYGDHESEQYDEDYDEGGGEEEILRSVGKDDDPPEKDYDEQDAESFHENYQREEEQDIENCSVSGSGVEQHASSKRKRIVDLEDENKRLREENKAIRKNFFIELMKIKKGMGSLIHVFSVYSGMSAEIASESMSSEATLGTMEGIKLKQIFGFGDGAVIENDSLDGIVAPKRLTAAGSFPHAVVLKKKTLSRQYEVEGRRQVVLKFRLVYKLNGNPASERLIRLDGMLSFKMTIHYADNHEEVERTDFERLSIPNLTDPILEHIDSRYMMNSEVVFKWHMFRARSSDTMPRAREFVVKVTPSIQELKNHPDLTVMTPPFVVLSKVTAKH